MLQKNSMTGINFQMAPKVHNFGCSNATYFCHFVPKILFAPTYFLAVFVTGSSAFSKEVGFYI